MAFGAEGLRPRPRTLTPPAYTAGGTTPQGIG